MEMGLEEEGPAIFMDGRLWHISIEKEVSKFEGGVKNVNHEMCDREEGGLQRDGAVGRGIAFAFVLFKDRNDFSTFTGRRKCRNLKEERKCQR